MGDRFLHTVFCFRESFPQFLQETLQHKILGQLIGVGKQGRGNQLPHPHTDPLQQFSIEPRSHTDSQNPAEFSLKGKPIHNFSIDPTSSIRTQLQTPFFRGRHGGAGKKRGEENLTNDTLPKRGFGHPPSYGMFSTPLRCQCSVFPVQESTTEQNRSSFGGIQKFSGERVLWYVFLPHTFCTPPYHGPSFCGRLLRDF